MSSPANQFDNPEVFEAVMGQIGPQMMLFAAKVIDFDHQIEVLNFNFMNQIDHSRIFT